MIPAGSGPSTQTLHDNLSQIDRIAEAEAAVAHVADPGVVPRPGDEKQHLSVLNMFNADPSLGAVIGQGGGHAFIRVDILKGAALALAPEPISFSSICEFIEQSGSHVEEVYWLSYRRLPSHQDVMRQMGVSPKDLP
jgi:hypothetical protein